MSLPSPCALDRTIAARDEVAATFIITPRPGFADRWLWIVYAGLGVGTLLVQLAALANGSWPAAVGAGLIACAVIAGINFRRLAQERRREEIAVTTSEVIIRRVAFCRPVREARMRLTGITLTQWEDRSGRILRLRLTAAKTHTEIGRELAPDERTSFAGALTRALRAAGAPITIDQIRPDALLSRSALGRNPQPQQPSSGEKHQ